VQKARDIQTARFTPETLGSRRALNSDAGPPELDTCAKPDEAGAALLSDAAVKLNLSARGYHRVLKVARTIADLDGVDGIARLHIAEALTYRKRSYNENSTATASQMVF